MRRLTQEYKEITWLINHYNIDPYFQRCHWRHTRQFIKRLHRLRRLIRYRVWLRDITKIHIIMQYLSHRVYFYSRVGVNWVYIFNYALHQSGRYIFAWRRILKVGDDSWKLRNRYTEEPAALNFIFGSQQIRFVLNLYSAYRSDTHTTVGAMINLRYNIELNKKHKHITHLTFEEREAEQLRTKKFVTWFKYEYRYDNFKGYALQKGLWKAAATESLLLKKAAIERSIKLKVQNKKKKVKDKKDEDTVLFNKRGNPKTEPILWKHRRRKVSSWFWFLRMLVQYLKNRPIKMNKDIILRILGVRRIYKLVIYYLIRCFKDYQVVFFLLNFNLKYSNDIFCKFAAIKKKARKRILKMERV